MVRRLLCAMFVVVASLNSGCSLFKAKEIVSQPDPNGSIDEKIAYHQNEIKVYQAAIEKERQNSVGSLQSRNMSEVRRSNNKTAMYERKIQENQQAIMELNNKKNAVSRR